MGYAKTTWKDRVVQKPLTYSTQNNADGTMTLTPKPGTVYEAGTPLNAAALNNMEDGIAKALAASGENVHLARSNTISVAAGATADFVVNYPAGTFTIAPHVTYSLYNSDINGLYTTAHGICVLPTKDSATIRMKNNGSTTQYYYVYVTSIGK